MSHKGRKPPKVESKPAEPNAFDLLSELRKHFGATKKSFSQPNVSKLSSGSGAYVLYAAHGTVAYVGASSSLRSALSRHFEQEDVPVISFTVYPTPDMAAAEQKKRELIELHNPPYNLTHVA